MIKKLFVKYKELVMYGIFGVLTTLINWIAYSIFMEGCGFPLMVSNILSWFVAVLFAFVTNKLWVFESKTWKMDIVWKECLKFFGARIATGVFEIVMVPLLVWLGVNQEIFGVEGFLAKMIVTIGVIILNYVFSKLFVFQKK